MPPSAKTEKQTEIARKGGKAAHAKGTAHRFTPEEAAIAGRKGGLASEARKRQAPTEFAHGRVLSEEFKMSEELFEFLVRPTVTIFPGPLC